MAHNEIENHVSQSEVGELRSTLRQLQARIDRQALVILVLKEMLMAGIKPTETEFLERLAQVAAEKADSKTCQKCGKALNPKHNRCIYCGEARPAELL
jgi:hypothetical protein